MYVGEKFLGKFSQLADDNHYGSTRHPPLVLVCWKIPQNTRLYSVHVLFAEKPHSGTKKPTTYKVLEKSVISAISVISKVTGQTMQDLARNEDSHPGAVVAYVKH
jgi:hypothetical protein